MAPCGFFEFSTWTESALEHGATSYKVAFARREKDVRVC